MDIKTIISVLSDCGVKNELENNIKVNFLWSIAYTEYNESMSSLCFSIFFVWLKLWQQIGFKTLTNCLINISIVINLKDIDFITSSPISKNMEEMENHRENNTKCKIEEYQIFT